MRITVDREALTDLIAQRWAGRTVIHPDYGVFQIPPPPVDGVTMQLIRLSVDTMADALERAK